MLLQKIVRDTILDTVMRPKQNANGDKYEKLAAGCSFIEIVLSCAGAPHAAVACGVFHVCLSDLLRFEARLSLATVS